MHVEKCLGGEISSLRINLAHGFTDALDAQELDGKFISASAAAGGRYDDRLHLRIVLDGAAPIVRMIAPKLLH